MTVTYHESCHLAHGQKVVTRAARAARLVPGVSLVELPESTWCCGSAGIYAITQPEQAELLLRAQDRARARRPARRWSRPPIPAASCRLREDSRGRDADVRVVHPISLLAAAYRREAGAAA